MCATISATRFANPTSSAAVPVSGARLCRGRRPTLPGAPGLLRRHHAGAGLRRKAAPGPSPASAGGPEREEVLAEAAKRRAYIEPAPGAEVQKASDAIIHTPKAILDLAAKAMK